MPLQAEIARLEGCLAAKQAECQRLQAEGAEQRQQTAAVVMEKEALQREQGRLQEQLADTKKQASPNFMAVAKTAFKLKFYHCDMGHAEVNTRFEL